MAGESQAIVTNGTKLQVGDGATPEVFTNVAEVVSITPPSQDPVEVDVSHLLSPAREKRAGLPDTGSAEFQINFLPRDTGHRQLFTDAGKNIMHNWKVLFPPPSTAPTQVDGVTFPGSVGSFNIDEIALDGAIRATVSIVSGPADLLPATP